MIARCSYYGPMRKAFDWFTKFENKENFGFRLVTAVQSDPVTPVKLTMHGTTKTKNNMSYGEMLFKKNSIA